MSGWPTTTGYPNEPPGLILLKIDGIECLAYDPGYVDPPDSPWANAFRSMGWYYGYPACCIEAFVARSDAFVVAHRAWLDRQPSDGLLDDDSRPVYEPRPGHPVSGHLLCHRCEDGPRAPLPPRPAERYGFVWPSDDTGLIIDPPSTYAPLDADAASPAPRFEQLALELEEAPAA